MPKKISTGKKHSDFAEFPSFVPWNAPSRSVLPPLSFEMIFFKEAVSSVEVEELLLCKQEVNLQFLTFSKVEDQSGTRQRLQFIRYLSTRADTPAKSKVCVACIESYEWTLVLERSFLIISFTAKKRQEKRNRLASHCCRWISSVHSHPPTCIRSLTAPVQRSTVSVTSRDSLYRLITVQTSRINQGY